MIPLDDLLARLRGVDAPTLTAWIEAGWVRPALREQPPDPVRWGFDEVDVARVRLIVELRELEVNEAAMPVVLDLLDQLHATRRQLRVVAEALGRLRGG